MTILFWDNTFLGRAYFRESTVQRKMKKKATFEEIARKCRHLFDNFFI